MDFLYFVFWIFCQFLEFRFAAIGRFCIRECQIFVQFAFYVNLLKKTALEKFEIPLVEKFMKIGKPYTMKLLTIETKSHCRLLSTGLCKFSRIIIQLEIILVINSWWKISFKTSLWYLRYFTIEPCHRLRSDKKLCTGLENFFLIFMFYKFLFTLWGILCN